MEAFDMSAGEIPTSKSAEDRVLLEGPHSRAREFLLVLRAVRDFISGFRALHFVGPCVTVFGSARYSKSHPYYPLARELGDGVLCRFLAVALGPLADVVHLCMRPQQAVGEVRDLAL